MSRKVVSTIAGLAVVVIAVVLVVLLVPAKKTNNDSINTNASSNAQQTAETKTIKSNFTTFFAADTSMSDRQALLQNGSQFAQPMQTEFTQLQNEKPSASVSSVSFPDQTTAKVIYTIDLNGQPVLKNQTGEAVLVNKDWLVSDSTLCQLFSLGGQTPSICNSLH